MPVFFLVIGFMFMAAARNGKTNDLLAQFKSDGQKFVVWFLLIMIIGEIGEVKTVRPISNAFLVLIFVAFALAVGKNAIATFKTIVGESK